MARNLTAEQRCAFVLADMVGLAAAEAAALMDLGEAAYRGLLHRARANLNAFFGDHCSLVRPENPCTCAAWSRLVADREALRAAVAARGGPPPFADPAYASRGNIATAPTVLALFRSIPDRLPPPSWFERAGAALAGLRAAR
jgi:RNA polymerase sigma-70 factor (ECF subfamily)